MQMKKFNKEFKTELYQTIEDIENNSQVEIVAMIKANSGNYRDISLLSGAVLLFLAYTYFMFAPTVFDVYRIYFMTILAFFIGFALVDFIPPLQKALAGKKRIEKNVEVYSRAIFQKGGIRHTSKKTGILIYVSIFEKKIKIVADKGTEAMLPAKESEKLKTEFQETFQSANFQTSFLEKLKNSQAVFSKYIPSVEDDINELPDDLDIDL